MNKNLPLFICGCVIVLTLFLRSNVYDIIVQSQYRTRAADESVTADSLITIHYHDRRPYYVSSGGTVHGLVADPIALIFKKTGIDFQWINTPAKRQLDLIRDNASATCAAGWFKTPEREKIGKYTLPIYQDRPFVAVARAENSLLLDIETLDRVFSEGRLKLLVKSGYSYGRYIDSKIKQLKPWRIVTTADNKSMLQMILNHRADYSFMTEEEANDLLLFSGIPRDNYKIISFKDIPEGSQRYLICSKKMKDTDIENLNSAIKYFLKIQESGK